FKPLFKEYASYKLYGAVAGMALDKGVKEEAERFGFYVLVPYNDSFTLLNADGFEATEVK
ncbi:MAG: hypothetical protein SNJ71_08735, partial [Bacteroidales bacterium]